MTGSTLQLLSFAAPSDREEQKERAERQMQRDRWRANEMVTDRVEHNAVEWSSTKLDLDSLAPEDMWDVVGTRFKKIWRRFFFSFGQAQRSHTAYEPLWVDRA